MQQCVLKVLTLYSQNILLDEYLHPHVADFGFLMAVPLQHGSRCLVSSAGALALAGTQGYLAPEFSLGNLGTKSDVYSYGVVSFNLGYWYLCSSLPFTTCVQVVLETFSGQLPYSEDRDDDNLVIVIVAKLYMCLYTYGAYTCNRGVLINARVIKLQVLVRTSA